MECDSGWGCDVTRLTVLAHQLLSSMDGGNGCGHVRGTNSLNAECSFRTASLSSSGTPSSVITALPALLVSGVSKGLWRTVHSIRPDMFLGEKNKKQQRCCVVLCTIVTCTHRIHSSVTCIFFYFYLSANNKTWEERQGPFKFPNQQGRDMPHLCMHAKLLSSFS